MSIENKVKEAFLDVLKVQESAYDSELAVGDIPEWDSVNHVKLLQEIEERFNISIEVADAIDIEDISELILTVKKYPN